VKDCTKYGIGAEGQDPEWDLGSVRALLSLPEIWLKTLDAPGSRFTFH
jgi:hypothetical protein